MSRYVALMIALFWLTQAVGCVKPKLNRGISTSEKIDKEAKVEDVPVRGFNVNVGHKLREFQGELIAVDDENLWLLDKQNVLHALKRSDILQVEIQLFPTEAGYAGAWTGLGTLSTLSHGFFLVFSAPVWLIGGISSTVAAAYADDITVVRNKIDKLYQYARFPQGPPRSFIAQFKGFQNYKPKADAGVKVKQEVPTKNKKQ